MNILLWSPWGAGLHFGGPGTNAFRMYSKLSTKFPGCEVSLAHGSVEQQEFGVFRETNLISDLDRGSLFSQLRFLFRSWRSLRQSVNNFDIVHCLTSYQLSLLPALVAERNGIPSVVKVATARNEIGSASGKSVTSLARHRRKLLRKVSAVVAISHEIEEELLGIGVQPKKIFRIPNGVNSDEFLPPRHNEKIQLRREMNWPNLFTVLFVGRVVPQKRPDLIVQAAALFAKNSIPCHFVFVGPVLDQSYANELLAEEPQSGPVVISWLPFDPDPSKFYRCADAFVLLSETEGMANVVLEAMSSGLPCVVSNASGMSDLIENRVSGISIERCHDQLFKELNLIRTNSSLADSIGKLARERVLEEFSDSTVLRRHIELFATLSGRFPKNSSISAFNE